MNHFTWALALALSIGGGHPACAIVIGEVNDLLDAQSFKISIEEFEQYSAIGRTECATARNTIYTSTAFHVGGYQTLITSAHSFVDPVTSDPISFNNCRVAFYNLDGSLRETLAIKSVHSRWDNPRYFGDTSNDIAIVVLSQESKTPTWMPEALVPAPLTVSVGVTVVGFALQETLYKTRLARRLGLAAPLPATIASASARQAGEPCLNPENSVAVSYDAVHGSSGSPVLRDGRVIGIHQGSQGFSGGEFNVGGKKGPSTYNRMMLFDKRFAEDLEAVLSRLKS